MELPWVVAFVFLCLSSPARSESSFSKQIRDSVGLGVPSSESHVVPGAVIIFINSSQDGVPAANVLEDGDLLSVAADLEQQDKDAVFLHYDGDNLITSKGSLFNNVGVDGQDQSATYSAVLERIRSHRGIGYSGSHADLLVFQSQPESFQAEVAELCNEGAVYDKGQNCKIVSAFVNPPLNVQRFRRAADDSSTTPLPPLTPTQRANIPEDSVAAFHLLFWTSLAIALTVWGFAYGMWHMDPGRDSIIYRMTSAQKFKKDK